MERKWSLVSVLVLGSLLILASGGMTSAQGPQPPDRVAQTQGEVSIAAVVNSKISYQGMLEESGQPVTGSRDMLFRLYSNNTCTTQVGSDIVQNGVQVADGLFSVELPVTQSDFNGQGLWLRVRVGPSTWIGCQEILPVPYALSLRPGATVRGAPGLGWLLQTGTADDSMTGALGGALAAVYGNTTLGYGVYGEARSTLGLAGVYGTSSNANGYGVHGENSAGGYAGYFEGDVAQRRADDGLVKAAVYAECGSSGSSVIRYFNNVNNSAITASNGAGAGQCTIDFNFAINDRFWSTSVYGPLLGQDVSCGYIGGSTDTLSCFRWSAGGVGVNGGIIIIVY